MAAPSLRKEELQVALTRAFNVLPAPPPAKRTLAECATLVAEHLIAEHEVGAPLQDSGSDYGSDCGSDLLKPLKAGSQAT